VVSRLKDASRGPGYRKQIDREVKEEALVQWDSAQNVDQMLWQRLEFAGQSSKRDQRHPDVVCALHGLPYYFRNKPTEKPV